MALRPSMDVLIARLRRLIGDAGDAQTFEDEELQEFLDVYRTEVRYLPLTAQEAILPGGTVEWHEFYSDYGQWERDVQLLDVQWNPIAADTSDFLTGRWTFEESQFPTVFINGRFYDLNGAAADALEEWAGKVKLKYDFSSADQKLMRSQQKTALLELAEKFRQKQRPLMAALVRTDAS